LTMPEDSLSQLSFGTLAFEKRRSRLCDFLNDYGCLRGRPHRSEETFESNLERSRPEEQSPKDVHEQEAFGFFSKCRGSGGCEEERKDHAGSPEGGCDHVGHSVERRLLRAARSQRNHGDNGECQDAARSGDAHDAADVKRVVGHLKTGFAGCKARE
jgi:hypothetical protein